MKVNIAIIYTSKVAANCFNYNIGKIEKKDLKEKKWIQNAGSVRLLNKLGGVEFSNCC